MQYPTPPCPEAATYLPKQLPHTFLTGHGGPFPSVAPRSSLPLLTTPICSLTASEEAMSGDIMELWGGCVKSSTLSGDIGDDDDDDDDMP